MLIYLFQYIYNSFTNSSANGFEVYYSTGTPITTYISEKMITEDGRDLTLETRVFMLLEVILIRFE